MSNIYVGQPFTVRLNTGVDLSTATSTRIRLKYLEGEVEDVLFDATVTGAGNTILQTNVLSTENTVAGPVEFWAWVVFPGDAGVVPGDPVKVIIKRT